jgi:putative transcriptional regulator
MNKTTITVRTRPDRTVEQKTERGWVKIEVPKAEPKGDPDHPACDPDNMPLTPERQAKMKRIPRARTLRRQLALTQEEFAERYQIPIGTLRDWEQGRSEPDAPAKALLKLIAADPEGAAKVLKPAVRPAAE